MQKIRLAFFGTPKFASTILESVINVQWLMTKAVVTQPDKPVGRKQILTPSPVKLLAQRHKIPVFDYTDSPTMIHIIGKIKPELIVVAAFGEILPKEILKIPKYGCLGIHPSLLPKYRGPTPVQFSILNGEKETGVTIFLMDEKMDQGKIISNTKYQISKTDTSEGLSKKLAELGAELLIATIPKWVAGEIKPKPQNHKKAAYTKLLTKKDGFVDWKKIVLATQKEVQPQRIERMVRAFTPWPGVWTKIKILRYKDTKILRLKILRAHLEGERLVLDLVQQEGKKPISWKTFLQGHPELSALSAT